MSDYEEQVKNNMDLKSEELIENGKIGNTLLTDLIKAPQKYDLTTAAKNIKKIVKDLCPETYLIKIKSSRFAGGDSINVDIVHDTEITDVQRSDIKKLARDIEKLLQVFSDRGFDSMSDSSFSTSTSFNDNYGSSSYIHCKSRSYYKEEYESFKKVEGKLAKKEKKILMKALSKESKKKSKISEQNDTLSKKRL